MAITGSAVEATPQVLATDGQVLSFQAAEAVNGHKFKNNNDVILVVKNTSGVARTLTVETGGKLGAHDVADRSIALANGDERLMPLLDPREYNYPSGHATAAGMVRFGVDVAAGVTWALVKVK